MLKQLNQCILMAGALALVWCGTAHADAPEGVYWMDMKQPIWDAGEKLRQNQDGCKVSYNMKHAMSGALSGSGKARCSRDNVVLNFDVSGSVKSKSNGKVQAKMQMPVTGKAQGIPVRGKATAKANIDDQGMMNGSMKVKVCTARGPKRCVTEKLPLNMPVDDSDGSWTLKLKLERNGDELSGSALAKLHSGRKLKYSVTGSYNEDTGRSKLKLAPKNKASKGSRIVLKNVRVANGEISFASYSARALGQEIVGLHAKLVAPVTPADSGGLVVSGAGLGVAAGSN